MNKTDKYKLPRTYNKVVLASQTYSDCFHAVCIPTITMISYRHLQTLKLYLTKEPSQPIFPQCYTNP